MYLASNEPWDSPTTENSPSNFGLAFNASQPLVAWVWNDVKMSLLAPNPLLQPPERAVATEYECYLPRS